MEHTWVETDPGGANEQYERIKRKLSLREKISSLSLAYFEVKYLPLLIKLFDPFSEINDIDLLALESIANGAMYEEKKLDEMVIKLSSNPTERKGQ